MHVQCTCKDGVYLRLRSHGTGSIFRPPGWKFVRSGVPFCSHGSNPLNRKMIKTLSCSKPPCEQSENIRLNVSARRKLVNLLMLFWCFCRHHCPWIIRWSLVYTVCKGLRHDRNSVCLTFSDVPGHQRQIFELLAIADFPGLYLNRFDAKMVPNTGLLKTRRRPVSDTCSRSYLPYH